MEDEQNKKARSDTKPISVFNTCSVNK